MTTLPAEIESQDETLQMMSRSVLMRVSFGRLGNAKKLPKGTVSVDADESSIDSSKFLLDSPELKEIAKLDGKISTWLDEMALPSPFGIGIKIMAIAMVPEAEEYMQARLLERESLVDAFMRVYEEEYRTGMREARGRLRAVFNLNDYPTPEEARARFSLIWSYLSLVTPDNLPPTLVMRERDRIRAQWEGALVEAQSVLRASMTGFVDHLVDVLTPDENGKPKRFFGSNVTKLTEFLRTFDARNITNDAALADIVSQARVLLEGVDLDSIRTSDDAKQSVLKSMVVVKTKLDTMVAESAGRQLGLEDEF